jgi:membrane protease YdiL (CAAX protease family)
MNRFVTILRSAAMAFSILLVGQGAWGGLLTANLKTTPSIPWALPAMGLVLWGMMRFLSKGSSRRELLRARTVSGERTAWTFVAGALAVVSLAGLWIVFFNLFKMSPNMVPDASKYPYFTLLCVAIMGSIVAPLVEEAGFRGYCQTTLERVFPGSTAVILSSFFFTIAHLTHGFFLPKLLVYFLFGAAMGTLAYVNKSILPGIPVHALGDFIFFTMVWPNDASRTLVWSSGANAWFWIHVAQAVIFGALSILAFRRLLKTYNTFSEVNRCEFLSQTSSSSPVATA